MHRMQSSRDSSSSRSVACNFSVKPEAFCLRVIFPFSFFSFFFKFIVVTGSSRKEEKSFGIFTLTGGRLIGWTIFLFYSIRWICVGNESCGRDCKVQFRSLDGTILLFFIIYVRLDKWNSRKYIT